MKRWGMVLLLAASTAAAQAPPAAPEVKLADLKTPPSPAFVLLGIEPTAVARPTTPRALGMALLSALEQDNGALPQNFAVELAPYWFSPRPSLTFDQYDHPGFWQGLKQSFSVSLATKGDPNPAPATPPATATGGTLIGAGGRASWKLGKRSELANQVLAAYQAKVVDLLLAAGPPQPGQPAGAGLPEDYQAQLRPFATSIAESVLQGRWILEAAGALTGRFPNNETSQGRTEKAAVWLTPSYRFLRSTFNPQTGELTQVPSVDFIAVGRYIHDRTAEKDGDSIDIGARLLWENQSFALSAEYVQRFLIDEPSERMTAMVEYKINDNLYLSGTLGKGFDDPTSQQGDLQAILGLNLNLGALPKLLPPPAGTP